METVQAMRRQAEEFLQRFDRRQKITFGILGGMLIVVIVATVLLLSRNNVEWSVLLSGMDAKEAGQVVANLKEKGVEAKLQGTDTIMVHADVVNETIVQLAVDGFPQSGMLYDAYKELGTGFSASDSDKKVALQRQYQENLRYTLRCLEHVADAAVMLNLAEKSQFVHTESDSQASAAVILTLKNSSGNKEDLRLTHDEVVTIFSIVQMAIPDLKEEKISISDTFGTLYTTAIEEVPVDMDALVQSRYDFQRNMEREIDQAVEKFLTGVVGVGNVMVAASVTLNFDEKESESSIISPPVLGETSGIVISERVSGEQVAGENVGGAVGADPNGAAPTYPEVQTNDNQYIKSERETNYDVNQINERLKVAKGKIEELSISVIVNSASNPALVDRISELQQAVSRAVGTQIENVSVSAMDFYVPPTDEEQVAAQEAAAQQLAQETEAAALRTRIIILGASLLLVAVVLFFVVRMLLKRRPATIQAEEALEMAGQYIDSETGEVVLNALGDIDLSEMAAEEKNDVRDQIEKYVMKDPASAAQLLRNWLEDEYR